MSNQEGQPLSIQQGQTGLAESQNVNNINVTLSGNPKYLELIYDDAPHTVGDGYEIPRVFPTGGANNRISSNEEVDRPRTFSTSSTLSDGSASTPVLCQQTHLIHNKADESNSSGKMDSILVIGNIKSNGCLGGMKKNATELKRNGETDLSTLEQLLPSIKKCSNTISSHQSVGGCTMASKGGINNNINTNSAYSNMVKQPLLEEEVTENAPESSHNSSNDHSETTIIIPLNYTSATTLPS
jgi:hypothetical protein